LTFLSRGRDLPIEKARILAKNFLPFKAFSLSPRKHTLIKFDVLPPFSQSPDGPVRGPDLTL